jgi:hypothetical protein
MAKYRRHLIALLGLAAWAVSLCAAPDAPKTIVSAVWMPGMAGTVRELFITPGGNVAPLPISVGSGGRGREVALDRGSATSLKLMVRAANSQNGASAWQSVGEVSIPSGGKGDKFLLLLAAQAGANTIRGMAVADDVDVFPVGTVRVANMSGAPLMAKIGNRTARYEAGFSAPVPYAKTASPGDVDIPTFPLAFATTDRLFFNGRVDAWPGSRTLVIVMTNPVPGKDPVVKSIIDRPTPPAAR